MSPHQLLMPIIQ